MGLAEEMATDARPKVSNERLEELAALVAKRRILEVKVQELEERLAMTKRELDQVEGEAIPSLFDELGLKTLTMKDGSKVEVTKRWAASIAEARRDDCVAWLENHGFGSLVKRDFIAKTPRGELGKQYVKAMADFCARHDMAWSAKETVHPQTLMAFVKEQKEAGAEFPDALFSVFEIRGTKVREK